MCIIYNEYIENSCPDCLQTTPSNSSAETLSISPIIAHYEIGDAARLHEIRGEEPEHAASAVITSAAACAAVIAKVGAVSSIAMIGSRVQRAGIPRTACALLAVDFDAAVGRIRIDNVESQFRADESAIECVLKEGVGELAGRFDEMPDREVRRADTRPVEAPRGSVGALHRPQPLRVGILRTPAIRVGLHVQVFGEFFVAGAEKAAELIKIYQRRTITLRELRRPRRERGRACFFVGREVLRHHRNGLVPIVFIAEQSLTVKPMVVDCR